MFAYPFRFAQGHHRPRPLLFLDIDGVMNTTDSCLRHHSGEVFAPEAMLALRWLVRRTGAELVVTSTRRREGLAAMRNLFLRNQLNDVAECVIALTPCLNTNDTDDMREDEITTWLENHTSGLRSIVIIDDKPFTGPLIRHLVLTNSNHGLTWESARLAAAKIIA